MGLVLCTLYYVVNIIYDIIGGYVLCTLYYVVNKNVLASYCAVYAYIVLRCKILYMLYIKCLTSY